MAVKIPGLATRSISGGHLTPSWGEFDPLTLPGCRAAAQCPAVTFDVDVVKS